MPIIEHKQVGGVKLVNTSKQGFTPVLDMLMSPSAKLEHFTSSSLKGFMIKLNVDYEHSEYASQTSRGRRSFTERETSFILKFVVLTRQNDTSLTPFKAKDKASESIDSFYEEAVLQRDIWAQSIQNGRKQICPSVANLSMFDNGSALNLLTDLLNVPRDAATTDVFNYFIAEITGKPYGMGILTMPNIVGSVTFGNYSRGFNSDAYSLAIARIVRLFIDIGVVHLDLHKGNILLFINELGELDCLIIDFGRACNVRKGNCVMLSREDREDYRDLREKLYKLHFGPPNQPKFMEHVINELGNLDYDVNQDLFNMPTDRPYQLVWSEGVPEKKKTSVYQNAYNLLGINASLETTHSRSYMKKIKKENPIVNLLTTYSSSLPAPPNPASSSHPSAAPISFTKHSSPNSRSSPTSRHSFHSSQFVPVDKECDNPQGCNIQGGGTRRRTRKRTKSKKYRKK